jgi:hypothetical protein
MSGATLIPFRLHCSTFQIIVIWITHHLHLKKTLGETIEELQKKKTDTVKPVLNGISRDQKIFPLKPVSV